ncbi:Crp/Fnr family transcriptional regulator [Rapidithrix thailandica]|uniref:Crp/Fnr family transcriptional regulator n=1 Tax=Rapidithrix thailandica TaxID=413964 RepID=A0AAW9SL74_9BACT
MKELVHEIDTIIPLSPEEKERIGHFFSPKVIQKNSFLIKEGQYCNEVFFVKRGMLRVYYSDNNGDEITCYFSRNNEFISSYTSFLTQTPTKENIQALEDCKLFSINRANLEDLSQEIPKIQIFRRVIAENLFIAMERRISMLQSATAQERYERIIKENPKYILNIPQQYIASFLGITPQHLSRLRKKITR